MASGAGDGRVWLWDLGERNLRGELAGGTGGNEGAHSAAPVVSVSWTAFVSGFDGGVRESRKVGRKSCSGASFGFGMMRSPSDVVGSLVGKLRE